MGEQTTIDRLVQILGGAQFTNGIARISRELVNEIVVTLDAGQAQINAKDKRNAELEADVHNAGQRLDEMAASLPTWIHATVLLPASGTKVLAWDGNNILRAMFAKRFTEEVRPGGEEEATEYSEGLDGYFLIEGWYERNEFDEVHWTIENPVTHWMPLPAPPCEGGNAMTQFEVAEDCQSQLADAQTRIETLRMHKETLRRKGDEARAKLKECDDSTDFVQGLREAEQAEIANTQRLLGVAHSELAGAQAEIAKWRKELELCNRERFDAQAEAERLRLPAEAWEAAEAWNNDIVNGPHPTENDMDIAADRLHKAMVAARARAAKEKA